MVKIKDYGIILSDGAELSYSHCCDCCECNYADFLQLEDTGFENETITKETLKIEVVDGSGFRINGYFVPCYSVQNGYYSSDLDITLDDEIYVNLYCEVSEDYPC